MDWTEKVWTGKVWTLDLTSLDFAAWNPSGVYGRLFPQKINASVLCHVFHISSEFLCKAAHRLRVTMLK